jgi:SagB-type dehydrogenase family enzyme
MNTIAKLAASVVGRLKPPQMHAHGAAYLALPAPERHGGMPLLEAIAARRSVRQFRPDPLPLQVLSNLLWAADGINRPDTGGRTAPSALNAQEIAVYVALAGGAYVYEPKAHVLHRVADVDARRVTGYQEFVDEAPVELVFVADQGHNILVPRGLRKVYAAVSAGAICQNVYLFCASAGLVTVTRGWFDRSALAQALALGRGQEIVLAQTVGYPI